MVQNFPKDLPIFYKGLYETLEDPSLDSVISWSESNKSFIIWNPEKLMHISLYGKFLCCTFERFLKRLHDLGFSKVNNSKHLEFGHKELSVRGKPELLKNLYHKIAERNIKKRFKAVKARKKVEERFQNLQI